MANTIDLDTDNRSTGKTKFKPKWIKVTKHHKDAAPLIEQSLKLAAQLKAVNAKIAALDMEAAVKALDPGPDEVIKFGNRYGPCSALAVFPKSVSTDGMDLS